MNNKLIYAKDISNNLIIINLEDLKKSDNLEGATVFNILFFKNKNLKKDKDGFVTILKELNIRSNEWYTLIRFVKSNTVNLHNEFKYNNKNLSKLIKNIEELYQVSIKLGGFPKIDQYYKHFWKHLHNKKSKKNLNKRKREEDECFDLLVGHCC